MRADGSPAAPHSISPPAGVLIIDKPGGITSHDVVSQVRRVAGLRQVGHAGTLDPLASGVLLVCLGQATRLVEYLTGQDKVYEATVRLGQETDSYDAEGRVVAERPAQASAEEIKAALARFHGAIWQIPPMFSAVKQGGQPLYKRARRGETVERAARPVTIYSLEMLGWNPPHLALRVACSAGTYIRSLAHDLGQILGSGGHLAALRRTAVGEFRVEAAASWEQLTPESLPRWLRPIDAAVAHLPRLELADEEAIRLAQGQRAPRRPGQPAGPLVRVYAEDGRFVGVAAAEGDTWQARKVLRP